MNTTQITTQTASRPSRLRSGLRAGASQRSARAIDERGAVGTEMAIVVAIVVAISIALGVVMTNSAEEHQKCIPATPGAETPEGC